MGRGWRSTSSGRRSGGRWLRRSCRWCGPITGTNGRCMTRRTRRSIRSWTTTSGSRTCSGSRSGARPFRDWTPITYLQEIRDSKVAVYHLAGWYDRYVRDQLVMYRNLPNPQRISIGPWTHTQSDRFDFAAEHLRWWDYWLKGIDNGVMREDPVHYYVMGAPEETAWRSAKRWPLPQER